MGTSILLTDTAAEFQMRSKSWPEIERFGLCMEIRGGRSKR